MTIRELPTIEASVFDEFATHPLASFAWGSIRAKTGLKVVRFGVFEGNKLVETYQMTLHKLPLIHFFVGYIPRSVMPSEVFLKYLKEYGKQYKIISVLFEPDKVQEAGAEYVHSVSAERPSIQAGALTAESGLRVRSSKQNVHIPPLLRVSSTPLFYKWTRIIDLSKSIEVLKSELDATARYNVGLAERKGVVVSLDDSLNGFEDFYTIYSATTTRQHFGGHSKEYHKTIWDFFSKEGVAHMLVAKYQGIVLCACELWLYKDTLYYTYAGSSMEHRNVKAMNALMWNVIAFGKEHGATKLDLWGVLPPGVTDPKNPWAGFTDFKKGFGGGVVEMVGSFDLVIFPFLHQIYVFGYTIRKLLKSLR